jgi:hypothetical protein
VASRVVTQLISDVSGEEIADGQGETVEFAYRGTSYSIDLTAREAADFDASMAVYLEHASKRGSSSTRSAGRSAAKGSDAKAIRAWAKDQGIDIPNRGRIPSDVRARYESSN